MKNMFLKIYGLMVLLISSASLYGSNVVAEIEYFYSDDGTLIGKAFNGKRVNYEYDLRGQLLAVKDASGKDLERYTYDPAGNRLSKTINGVTTTYSYDEANQLIRSTVNGEKTYYEYDAAGRMIQAGDKSYIYNGNNKVIEVRQNGKTIAKFEYNIDGQIAKAIYGDKKEEFIWDGLALIWRSGVTYINEPYVTGGNPVMAGDDVLFNDMLGSTLAVNDKAVEMTSFGETDNENVFFTGKPMIDELGYSFLFRDYNPNQGKWTTSDPLGYPDGWNQLAYCNNAATSAVDLWGCAKVNYSMTIGGSPENPNHAGVTKYSTKIMNIFESTHTVVLHIDINIAYSDLLYDSSRYSTGSEVTYIPHNGVAGGELSENVREAVEAHERGHADYVVNVICPALKNAIELLEAKWIAFKWDVSKVRDEVYSTISLVNFSNIKRFNEAANAPTINWFNSSPEWLLDPNGLEKGEWRWVKE